MKRGTKKEDARVLISMHMDRDLLERLDGIADRTGTPRAELIRDALRISIDSLEFIGERLHRVELIRDALRIAIETLSSQKAKKGAA
jgi:metal-responsive CopG/Arc/MetJ family transcriptional regulator